MLINAQVPLARVPVWGRWTPRLPPQPWSERWGTPGSSKFNLLKLVISIATEALKVVAPIRNKGFSGSPERLVSLLTLTKGVQSYLGAGERP